MTRGIFKFQIVQDKLEPIELTKLNMAKVLIIRQGLVSKLMIRDDKIDELINALKDVKKWLSSEY